MYEDEAEDVKRYWRREFDGKDYSVDRLAKGALGWAERFDTAVAIASYEAGRYGKRHRVFWSYLGEAWLIRRAFVREAEEELRKDDW